MPVRVQRDDFNINAEIDVLCAGNAAIGAVAAFIGLVRDINGEEKISAMCLEHYPGMTEKALEAIVAEAKQRFGVIEIVVIHRVGDLRPADPIVLVAAAGVHRGEVFQACEYVMDYLKTRAPFWKREQTANGERWVDARESDASAAERWSGSGHVHSDSHLK